MQTRRTQDKIDIGDRGGGGGGQLPYKNDGVLVGNLARTPKRLYQFQDKTLLPATFFGLNDLKGTAKSSRCGSFEGAHPNRYQNRFFKP